MSYNHTRLGIHFTTITCQTTSNVDHNFNAKNVTNLESAVTKTSASGPPRRKNESSAQDSKTLSPRAKRVSQPTGSKNFDESHAIRTRKRGTKENDGHWPTCGVNTKKKKCHHLERGSGPLCIKEMSKRNAKKRKNNSRWRYSCSQRAYALGPHKAWSARMTNLYSGRKRS